MTDRKLLDLAAKAAGIEVWPGVGFQSHMLFTRPAKAGRDGRVTGVDYNPLTDDGDALRLAVALKLSVKHGIEIWDDTHSMSAYAYYGDVGECHFEAHDGDPYAATRRAIVRAAAAIGEAMP